MGLLPAPRMQVFPLVCSRCGEPMRIIAFGTEVGSVHRILAHLGEAHPTSAHRPGRPRSSPGRRTSNPAKALTSASHHPSMSSISGELVGTMPLRTFLRANVTQPAPADLCLDIRPSAIRRPKAPTITRNPAGIGPKASYRPRAGRRITGRPVRRNSSCLFPVASHSSSHGGPGHLEPATPTDPRPRP
jgi:hypothetical protein